MKIFISPSEQIGKIIESSELVKQLRLRWSTVNIDETKDSRREFIIEWEININEDYLTGKLGKTEDVLVFTFSTISLGADFSIWAYNILTKKDNIILYDDSYSTVMPLEMAPTVKEVIREFS